MIIAPFSQGHNREGGNSTFNIIMFINLVLYECHPQFYDGNQNRTAGTMGPCSNACS